MKTFALITEGITDQVVLEDILIGFYEDEPDVRWIQPPRDETDKRRQGDFAGWENVLEHIGFPEFQDIFSTNDYVIIQVDTDVCEQKNFGVPLHTPNGEKSVAELINDVQARLICAIGEKVYENYKDQIIFAVCVHSIECWLLPLFSEKKFSSKIKGCEAHLAKAVNRHNKKYYKDYRTYRTLTSDLCKTRHLEECRQNNVSMDIFLNNLPV